MQPCLACYVDEGDLHSGPYACTESTFSTQPSPIYYLQVFIIHLRMKRNMITLKASLEVHFSYYFMKYACKN